MITRKTMKFEDVMPRQDWWILQLVIAVFSAFTVIVCAELETRYPDVGASILIVAAIFQMYISIAVNKARANDAGWNGWIQFFPLMNILVLGFFGTKDD